MVSALRECNAPVPDLLLDDDEADEDEGDDPDTTTTTEPDDDNGSASGPGGDGMDLPPGMISMIAEQMADELGLSQDQAE